jgi:hypothetical protein
LQAQILTSQLEKEIHFLGQITNPAGVEVFREVYKRKKRAENSIVLGVQRFCWNCLSRLKEFEQPLGSVSVGVSRGKRTKEISRTGSQNFLSRNWNRLHPFVIFKPELKQLCLKVVSQLLHFGLVRLN